MRFSDAYKTDNVLQVVFRRGLQHAIRYGGVGGKTSVAVGNQNDCTLWPYGVDTETNWVSVCHYETCVVELKMTKSMDDYLL